jgi:nuclear receptor interaction protein
MHIARALVKLRKALFSLEVSVREAGESSSQADLALYKDSFSTALTLASEYLSLMDGVMRTWGYPLNPTPDVVMLQQALRRNREASWRFVQAAGTLARILGGDIQGDSDPSVEFLQIMPAPGENNSIDRKAQFGYDFLKAILLFLEGGRESLLAGFKSNNAHRRNAARYPLPNEAEDGAIETELIPYLRELAGDTAVVNVDASRFEYDSSRVLFPSQHAAVTAFANVVKLPLEDLENTAASVNGNECSSDGTHIRALDRSAVTRFWGLKVARGILMEAGSGVNYAFTNHAFGGLRTVLDRQSESETGSERSQTDINPDVEEDSIIRQLNMMSARRSTGGVPISDSVGLGAASVSVYQEMPTSSAAGDTETSDESLSEHHAYESESDENESDDAAVEEDEGDSSDGDDGDDDEYDIDISSEGSSNESDSSIDAEERMLRLNGMRSTRREDVELDAPCSSHTRVYRGHCNVKTVKDVNFFGLNDEYVVSGSDLGHLFIWDRKTCDLVNILEGDSEVVNVVQGTVHSNLLGRACPLTSRLLGHPYEPTIAASGIDNTIKIFSPDKHSQDNARRGINILNPENPANVLGPSVSNIGGLKSCKRMQDSYSILSQNEAEREGGMNDATLTVSLPPLFLACPKRQIQADSALYREKC